MTARARQAARLSARLAGLGFVSCRQGAPWGQVGRWHRPQRAQAAWGLRLEREHGDQRPAAFLVQSVEGEAGEQRGAGAMGKTLEVSEETYQQFTALAEQQHRTPEEMLRLCLLA